MNLYRDEKTGIWYRKGTDDLQFLSKEIIMRDHLPLKESDVVMEIGANIGDTTKWLCSQVRSVFAYEPLKSGVECARRNAPDANIIQAAIGIKADKRKIYYRPDHLSSANRFVELKKCRIVDYILFNVELHKRRPTFILMDCEGEEWNLTKYNHIPFIEGIAIEFHFHKHILQYYKDRDSDIFNKMKFIQVNGPEYLMLSKQFGPPIWKHGFAKHRNVSFAIWRKEK